MADFKKNLGIKGTGTKTLNREFGEILEAKLSPEDIENGKKASLYIKITATDEDLAKLRNGFTISMEDPKAKFLRQLDKFADNAEVTTNITERMNNLPKFVKKRLTMRVPV